MVATTFPTGVYAADYGQGILSPACGESVTGAGALYPQAVRDDDPIAYWRLCQFPAANFQPVYKDESGHNRPLYASPTSGTGYAFAPTAAASGSSHGPAPLTNEVNGYQVFNTSYMSTPGGSVYEPLRRQRARVPFTIEAWTKPKVARTTCDGCNHVEPIATAQGSWQLAWAGTGAAKGRGLQAGGPVGANGWVFSLYSGIPKKLVWKTEPYPPHWEEEPDSASFKRAERLTTTYPISPDRWYHLVAVWDGTQMHLYVNGSQVASRTLTAPLEDVWRPGEQFQLGAASDEDNAERFLNGKLDEVAYYDHALTAQQVAHHYAVATMFPLPPAGGPPSAYRDELAKSNPYVWFPLDDHHVEPEALKRACAPCPAHEATTGGTHNRYSSDGSFRDISGPSALGSTDRGADFRSSARLDLDSGPKVPVPASADFTVDLWLQTSPDTPAQQTFFVRSRCGGCNGYLALRLNAGRLEVRADLDSPTFGAWADLGGAALDDDRWHHVQVSRVHGASKYVAYVDGVPTGVTAPAGTSTTPFRGNSFTIGDVNNWFGAPAGHIALDEFTYYTRVSDEELLMRHRPFLAFDEEEQTVPQEVRAFINNWNLSSPSGNWTPSLANRLLDRDTQVVLAAAGSPNPPPPRLDESWLGATYPNGQTADTSDMLDLSGDTLEEWQVDAADQFIANGSRPVVYGRATRDSVGKLWLQYWVPYYYNGFEFMGFGPHEGDWELIQLRLDETSLIPLEAVYSAHNGGARCDWSKVPKRAGEPDVPVVFVAANSHAAYFKGGTSDDPVGSNPDRHRGNGQAFRPAIEMIRDGAPGWTAWPGDWGSTGPPTGSPAAPVSQAGRWSAKPFADEAGSCPVP